MVDALERSVERALTLWAFAGEGATLHVELPEGELVLSPLRAGSPAVVRSHPRGTSDAVLARVRLLVLSRVPRFATHPEVLALRRTAAVRFDRSVLDKHIMMSHQGDVDGRALVLDMPRSAATGTLAGLGVWAFRLQLPDTVFVLREPALWDLLRSGQARAAE